jgi:hypothetical protein
MLPRFLPVRTSLREAQQQHIPSWMIQARISVPAATHMKANISTPMEAPMLSWVAEVIARCMMMNWTDI